MMPPTDDQMMFEDPQLMQQLGLGQYMQQEPEQQQTDVDKPAEGSAWSITLILCGILLVLAWMAIPLGALGAWFYGPIAGFAAEPVFSRFEFMLYTIAWLSIGVAVSSIIMNAVPKVHWVENDPGMPRTTYLTRDGIQDMGDHYVLTRRDKRTIRVRKDICSRYKNKVHVTANVLEINSRSECDIEFRTTQGRMSRGAIEAEEDLAMRQSFREEQLEQISGQFVQGQLDQIEGGMM